MSDEGLLGGVPIDRSHIAGLRDAFRKAEKRAWVYYSPFLLFFSLPPSRVVYVSEADGDLLLLVKRSGRRGERVDLLVPPVPVAADRMLAISSALAAGNPDGTVRVLWVDEEDAGRMPEAFQLRPKDSEYIYDPHRVAELSGRDYRDVRKRVRRAEREARPSFREMGEEDIEGCRQLHALWRRTQGRKQDFLLDWGYTKAALDGYTAIPNGDLRGWCVEVEERIGGFAMAGPIKDGLASFFTIKADPSILGLSEYLRWKVFESLSEYSRVNDAGDLDLPGLRQHKRKFRPVEMLPVYSAVYRREDQR